MITVLAQTTDDCGSVVCRWVSDLSHNDSLARFVDWVVAKPLKVALIFLLAYLVNRLLRRGIRKTIDRLVREREERTRQRHEQEVEDGRFASLRARAMAKAQLLAVQAERSQQRTEALGTVLRSLASLVVYGMAAIIALGEFGVSLGPLVAGAGVVGVALGFGAQSLVRDFLSGIFMLVEDQYGVGDVIDVGDATGVVEEVNLRTTRLRDVNGTVWFFPNGEIRRVGNKSQQWARTVLDIDVSYDTDLGRAAEVIKAVADSVWHDQLENATVLEEPELWGVEAFRDSSVALRLVVKVEPGEQWTTAREIRKRLKRAFDEAGIEIPFPQRTVWMREPAPGSAPPAATSPDFESTGEPSES
jgi:small-conductance mechanosensitive channel